MIKQKLQLIKQGKLTAEENIQQMLDKIKKQNKEMNIVFHLNTNAVEQAKLVDKKVKQGKAGKLAGLGFLVKSNINVEGLICNCASKTLENYRAGYSATVIDKLFSQDAIVLGMVNMDEFASGASGETSAFGCCKNPIALDRIPGGSSSGSAAGVAAGFCDFALGSDTGGSIRNPASHCGIVGFKPSYGVVSRYGLIDLSMSLDQIGVLAKNIEDCEIVFNIIKGKDEKDAVSREISSFYFKNQNMKIEKLKIGVLKINASDNILKLIKQKVEQVCKKNNWKAEDVELAHVDLGVQTYYPIVYTEFFSGTRKFDGRKYGFKIEDSCGEEVLRRILGGQEISKEEYAGKYYRKALAAKKIIEKEFEQAFKTYDVIVMPTVPKLPHKIGERISVEDMYNYDVCTCLANLAEIPGVSIPCGKIEDRGDKVPVGVQILACCGNDNFMLEVGKRFE